MHRLVLGRELMGYCVEQGVPFIANTRTAEGLTVQARLDTQSYPTGIRIDDEAMLRINLEPQVFHPVWNYVIHPQNQVE